MWLSGFPPKKRDPLAASGGDIEPPLLRLDYSRTSLSFTRFQDDIEPPLSSGTSQHGIFFLKSSLKLTVKAPENGWLSFREGIRTKNKFQLGWWSLLSFCDIFVGEIWDIFYCWQGGFFSDLWGWYVEGFDFTTSVNPIFVLFLELRRPERCAKNGRMTYEWCFLSLSYPLVN